MLNYCNKHLKLPTVNSASFRRSRYVKLLQQTFKTPNSKLSLIPRPSPTKCYFSPTFNCPTFAKVHTRIFSMRYIHVSSLYIIMLSLRSHSSYSWVGIPLSLSWYVWQFVAHLTFKLRMEQKTCDLAVRSIV